MNGESNHKDVIAENERLRQRIRELEEADEERDRLRAALRRSEEHVRLFVTYTPAAFAMFDRDMRYILVSHRHLADFGLREEDVIGRCHYEIFPDMPEHWKAIHQRCLAGASEGNDEEPFPRADGHVEWGSWRIFPWHTTTGEIGGIVLFSEVVTKRKQLEDKLRMQAKTLLELSAPIVPIRQGVLVLPLVGALDAARAQQMMENLLGKVAGWIAAVGGLLGALTFLGTPSFLITGPRDARAEAHDAHASCEASEGHRWAAAESRRSAP